MPDWISWENLWSVAGVLTGVLIVLWAIWILQTLQDIREHLRILRNRR